MDKALGEQILKFIGEETSRINYGKIFVEVTVAAGKATNIQCETKRSMNINSSKVTTTS